MTILYFTTKELEELWFINKLTHDKRWFDVMYIYSVDGIFSCHAFFSKQSDMDFKGKNIGGGIDRFLKFYFPAITTGKRSFLIRW